MNTFSTTALLEEQNVTASYRNPLPEDGAAIHQLIADCPPLDQNSRYCNLLQCSHFSDTSIIAEIDKEIVAFVSGYLVPKREDTIFIWQIAVAESARRHGLALQMLFKLLQQPACHNVCFLETTITEKNTASNTLFTKFSDQLGVNFTKSLFFKRDYHFNNQHDDEYLYRIGPFNRSLLTITNP